MNIPGIFEANTDFVREDEPWETFTMRTDFPKLAWLIHRLWEAGIFYRFNGNSFHAPILQITSIQRDQAWDILDPVDDVPDDDPCFQPKICEECNGPSYGDERCCVCMENEAKDREETETHWQ